MCRRLFPLIVPSLSLSPSFSTLPSFHSLSLSVSLSLSLSLSHSLSPRHFSRSRLTPCRTHGSPNLECASAPTRTTPARKTDTQPRTRTDQPHTAAAYVVPTTLLSSSPLLGSVRPPPPRAAGPANAPSCLYAARRDRLRLCVRS